MEIYKVDGHFHVRETDINPDHVIRSYSDGPMQSNLHEGYLKQLEIDDRASFTKLELLENKHVVVVGSLPEVRAKVLQGKKRLLLG